MVDTDIKQGRIKIYLFGFLGSRMVSMYTLILPLIFGSISSLPLTDNYNSDGLNDRPIIAVLAQQSSPFEGYSYIAASYIKYLESVGARVVPISESFSQEEVKNIYKYVNGIFFPGGGTKWFTSSYYKNAVLAIKTSMDATLSGQDYFPVWGTCLGYETLNVITANSKDVLSHFDANDISIPLNYTDDALNSRLFKETTPELYKAMNTEDVTYNHRSYGISPKTHKSNKNINGFFKILSTSRDSKGKEFVSTIEARDFPIYGTQWHPEKNNFEFDPDLHIAHSDTAVRISLNMANFFVNEARKSRRRFPSRDMEEMYLIYRYKPTYTGIGTSTLKAFEQVYLFKN